MKKFLLLWFFRGFDYLCSKLPSVGMFQPLRSKFLAIVKLEQRSLPGAFLFHHQPLGPCTSGSMTERANMQQNNHQPWPVFWVRSDKARLVGSFRLWRDEADHWCSEDAYHSERLNTHGDRPFAQTFVCQPLFLEGAWTSISSKWGMGDNYYHWMTDCLTRLLVREALPEPTRILVPRTNLKFVWETLDILGLTSLADCPSASILQPERYYFCSPTAMTGAWNPRGFSWLKGKFAPYLQFGATGKAVFLTRRHATRMPNNLDAIENIFSRNGFIIVDCAAHSVKEQIRIASSAPAIAGIHGAAMTNLLWARPNTPVLEIFAPNWLNAAYEQIALHGGLYYSAHILDQAKDIPFLDEWCHNAGI
jgi:hypothetical protein